MKSKLVTLLLPMLACIALAGCSNSNQPQTKAPEANIDPCSYLTAAEIESVLGWKVATIEPKAYGPTGACKYKSATPFSAKGIQTLDVLIGRGMPDMSSAEAMAAWRKGQAQGEAYKNIPIIVEPVKGLGVPAIYNGVEKFISIEMAVGDKLISIASVDSREKARKLGEKLLAHAK